MAFLFTRIHCHFCGARSPHSKSSGLPSFQCKTCEAWNYLDSRGEIADTPYTVPTVAAAPPERPAFISPPRSFTLNPPAEPKPQPIFQTFTYEQPQLLDHQKCQVFCNTCLHNQHVYNETLSNYFPDDDHPRYQEFEDAFPRFQADLERRYPQVCRTCAPKAQAKISRADYYGLADNAGKLQKNTKKRMIEKGSGSVVGMRDDWGKWAMRAMLNVVGLVIWASLGTQMAWHAYAICTMLFRAVSTESETSWSDPYTYDSTDLVFNPSPSPSHCARQALSLHFSSACYDVLGTLIPRTLLVHACLLWYHHGLKDWWHHTYRMEAITGATEHFRVQLILLIARAIAYYKLSSADGYTTSQALAGHGFTIIFMLFANFLSSSQIKSVRWRFQGKMMPKPEDQDVLGAFAGPEKGRYVPQASSLPAQSLLDRYKRSQALGGFPIENLAPKRPGASGRKQPTYAGGGYSGDGHGYTSPGGPPPSPPVSEDTVDDEDVMEIDWQPVMRAQTRSTRNKYTTGLAQPAQPAPSGGWNALRSETFAIQDNLRAQEQLRRREEEQKAKLSYAPVQPSPFRGRLPQAPMSMERRLRNPVRTVEPFKAVPITQRNDFLQQMREGIEKGRNFHSKSSSRKKPQQSGLGGLDLGGGTDEDEYSPAKSRTKGQLDLKPSTWHLPADTAIATGLEDLFGGSFRISEEPEVLGPEARKQARAVGRWLLGAAVVGGGAAIGAALWASGHLWEMWRTGCLWLVEKLEAMGY